MSPCLVGSRHIVALVLFKFITRHRRVATGRGALSAVATSLCDVWSKKKFCQACNNFLSENSPLFKTGAPWAEEVLWPERFAALLS